MLEVGACRCGLRLCQVPPRRCTRPNSCARTVRSDSSKVRRPQSEQRKRGSFENKRPAQRKDRPFCGQEGPRPAGDRPTVSGRAGLAFQSHPTEGSCKQKATCYPMPSEGQHPTRTRCVGLSAQSQALLRASLASNGSMGSRPMALMLHFAHELIQSPASSKHANAAAVLAPSVPIGVVNETGDPHSNLSLSFTALRPFLQNIRTRASMRMHRMHSQTSLKASVHFQPAGPQAQRWTCLLS